MEDFEKKNDGSLDDRVSEQSQETGKSPKGKKEVKKKSVGREILSFVGYIAVILVITFLIVRFVGVRTEVIGTSMTPTLQDGDNLIVEKVSYYFTDPQRYDIIVFPYPEDPGKHYIKRIIGLPGETVQIIDGYVYIDGELLDEHYGNAVMENAGLAGEPIVLGDDEYFVLGDNRNNSEDSRYPAVGNIKRSQISGRAWLRIWPLDKIGFLQHQ
ncbi:signal peptidase I [Catenibacillus scindens]|uniref:Signal peptidase I n=1 Tax=Catenibacillus scindens TaxID=673271 RepID=A0A7W8HD40_9FIRM|nr:signal peptidase I [Catenibacillus scindens]MBB5265490.1 signal peptidase I [Catenibacillus scindens]